MDDQLFKMTGAKQTMLSWAKVLESYADIPEVYKDSCKAVLENCHPFPYVVLAPVISEKRKKDTEKLLCEIDGVFHVWERADTRVISKAYPMKSIYSLELGSVLLFSWLTINGLTSDGAVNSTTIAFNTVTRRFLLPFIEQLRPVPALVDEADWQVELAKFDYLSSSHFKFMNYARESLVRGDKVIGSIMQPKIRKLIFTLFGQKFYRDFVLSHLALLTNREAIFIREDENSAEIKGKGERYGGVWQYIPLRNIAASEIIELENGLLTLSIELAVGGQRLHKTFEASNRKELEDFQRKLNQAVGK